MARRTCRVVMACAVGCSGGSGVDGSKSLSTLSPEDFRTVCDWYNAMSRGLVGQTCSKTQTKVPSVIRLDCGTNPFAGKECPARVADVEACAASTDACSALGVTPRPKECLLVASCVD